jgi:gamma-glutamylaminecyclotransferase
MKIFVYGSLKKNFGNNRFLINSNFISNAYIEGKYKMINLGSFPGVLKSNNIKKIFGEVYEVNNNVLSNIDALEGNPTFYKRIDENAVLENNEIVKVQFYLLNDYYKNFCLKEIEDGIWNEEKYKTGKW